MVLIVKVLENCQLKLHQRLSLKMQLDKLCFPLCCLSSYLRSINLYYWKKDTKEVKWKFIIYCLWRNKESDEDTVSQRAAVRTRRYSILSTVAMTKSTTPFLVSCLNNISSWNIFLKILHYALRSRALSSSSHHLEI